MKNKAQFPDPFRESQPTITLSSSSSSSYSSVRTSSENPILSRILHLERSLSPGTRLRRTPSSGVEPIDLLEDLPARRRALAELQPADGAEALAVLAGDGAARRVGAVDLLERAVAEAVVLGVEVEVRRRRVEEEVVAAQVRVGRRAGVRRRRHGEVERDGRDQGQQRGLRRGDAGDVEEGGYSADGDGDGGRIREVAGVVLGPAADGYVGEREAGSW